MSRATRYLALVSTLVASILFHELPVLGQGGRGGEGRQGGQAAPANFPGSNEFPDFRRTIAVSSASAISTLDTSSSFRSDRSSPAAQRLHVSPLTAILTSSI